MLFEQSEFALYTIEQELHATHPDLACEFLIGDVRDAARGWDELMASIARQWFFMRPPISMCRSWSCTMPGRRCRNNVLGTWTVARAAQQHGVSKFVMISTDKAVNPTNVMGASKRLAEMVCQALQPSGATSFVMVRFGNVLGSTGSVIPKFREQIAKAGRITVTHPDITRYFMSMSGSGATGVAGWTDGQGREIFVLDMGEPVKIVDLAKDLIHLSGLAEDDIRIEFTGLRPGEKLYEELLADSEHTLPTPHPKLRIARAREVDAAWLEDLLAWGRRACHAGRCGG